ncbi:MAG: exodeoxyribonuclease V subunit gamma, partial [Verrucomicrobiota bacterium]
MPFHLHTGNRLDRLADQLAEVVRAPLASVFTPEMVVVQSLGMARWLKLELARRLGVCARMEFPFPRAFTDRLSREMLPVVPAGEPFRREVVQWRLFRLLGALPETAD